MTVKLRALLNEIEDPAVESALRAVSESLVDAAVERIAGHVVQLERRDRDLEQMFWRIDAVLQEENGDEKT